MCLISFKDYVCISSTDLKGGEKPPQKIMKTNVSEIIPSQVIKTDDPPLQETNKFRTETRISRQNEDETNTSYMTRRVLEKSKDVEIAETFFEVLLRNANTPNSLGRIYTEDETGQTFIECMSILHPPTTRDNRERRQGKRKGKIKRRQKP